MMSCVHASNVQAFGDSIEGGEFRQVYPVIYCLSALRQRDSLQMLFAVEKPMLHKGTRDCSRNICQKCTFIS